MELYPFHKAAMPKHGLLPQLLRVMRITAILLLVGLMQVSAASFAQRLTLVKKNVSLKEVFTAIKTQTGYNVVCDSELLKDSKNVSTRFKEAELAEVLDAVLKNQNLDYTITDKTVVIKEKEPTFVEHVIARFQAIDIRGKIVDKNGQALPGATIKVKGTIIATTSDSKGEFSLSKVDGGVTLVISFVGFAPVEILAKAEMGSIVLSDVDAKLDEVQVIAYGTTSKRFSTSNVGTISAEQISKQPVSNPLLALQGRVPGLFIQQQSGVSASDVSVMIQGRNSMQNGSDPFYVIDGVPYTATFTGSSPSGSLMGAAITGSPSAFNFINPADIESVSILKDADATAIYGSRAANGAILITTKKGKSGKTKVDVDLQNGWGKITRKVDLLNTQQYLELRKEAFVNATRPIPTSATNPTAANYDLTIWDQNRYTDWQEVLVGGTAHFTNMQASISGGNSNTQFLASYAYSRQTTVYPNSLADVKGNVHLSLNHTSSDNKFKYEFLATYLQDKNQLNNVDLMDAATKLAPNAPALYKADGTLNFEAFPNNPNRYSFNNPLVHSLQTFTGTTSNLIANNTISYEIANNLVLKSSMGYNRLEGDELKI
ncbi:MAG: SusC/RagA family TonB-linked outer membrane protein, partial [Pedobacter sp.]